MTKKLKNKKSEIPGTCRRCGTRNVMIDEKCLCNRCFRKVLRNANLDIQTYVGSERLDRKEWQADRFTRSCIFDVDAESGLGGLPDYDAWFPPEFDSELDDGFQCFYFIY